MWSVWGYMEKSSKCYQHQSEGKIRIRIEKRNQETTGLHIGNSTRSVCANLCFETSISDTVDRLGYD